MDLDKKYMKLRSFNAVRAVMFGYEMTELDWLILLRSKLHKHTEGQFSSRFNSISFSATMAEGANCARFKDIKYSHPEYWDTVLIPCEASQEEQCYAKAQELEGRPYDQFGLLSFASEANIIKPNPNKGWCTETVFDVVDPVWPAMLAQVELRTDQLHPTMGDMIARNYFK